MSLLGVGVRDRAANLLDGWVPFVPAPRRPAPAPGACDDVTPDELDLLRRRVINVVGHELRTPITTLRGLADLLAAEEDPEKAAVLREGIARTARRVEALLDDLLLAAGVSTALPVADPEPTEIAGVVVLARPGVVDKVLAELRENAERYAGHPPEVTARVEGDQAVVVVADRGPGVPPEELPLVCEPFFRGEAAVLTHHSLGLGLAVVKALVEQAGGSVAVRNREGGGFEVELRFPRAG